MSIYLTEDDAVILREMAADYRKRKGGGPRRATPQEIDHQAPETYIAETPSGGIDGMEGTEPGKATCTIWRILDDGTPELLELSDFDKVVYNIDERPVHGNYKIKVTRDKLGYWLAASGFVGCCENADPVPAPPGGCGYMWIAGDSHGRPGGFAWSCGCHPGNPQPPGGVLRYDYIASGNAGGCISWIVEEWGCDNELLGQTGYCTAWTSGPSPWCLPFIPQPLAFGQFAPLCDPCPPGFSCDGGAPPGGPVPPSPPPGGGGGGGGGGTLPPGQCPPGQHWIAHINRCGKCPPGTFYHAELMGCYPEGTQPVIPKYIEQLFSEGSAGQVPTVQSDGSLSPATPSGGGPTIITSSADETANSSTLVTHSELTFQMAGDATYKVRLHAMYNVPGGISVGFRYRITASNSAAIVNRTMIANAPANANIAFTAPAVAYDGADRTVSAFSSGNGVVIEEMTITNGASVSDFQFKFAQESTDGSNPVAILEGSTLEYSLVS